MQTTKTQRTKNWTWFYSRYEAYRIVRQCRGKLSYRDKNRPFLTRVMNYLKRTGND